MTRADTRLFEHVVTRAVVSVSFLCLCPVVTKSSSAHLRMAQVNKAFGDLPRCLVQKRIVRSVLALIHGLACCPHLLMVGHNPESVSSYVIHNPDEY